MGRDILERSIDRHRIMLLIVRSVYLELDNDVLTSYCSDEDQYQLQGIGARVKFCVVKSILSRLSKHSLNILIAD